MTKNTAEKAFISNCDWYRKVGFSEVDIVPLE
jgi:hypothetical protein